MKLESIELTNFRNIRSLRLKADAGVNIIHGENAQGKTNLTEAIWMFTGAKSFRGAKDKEMIRFGETSCKSSITFSSTMREQCASIELFSSENVSPDRKLKHIELNGITLESTSELFWCASNGHKYLWSEIGNYPPHCQQYHRVLFWRSFLLCI